MDFTILADESIGSNHRSIIGSNHRPIERFLGITRIAISKTAAAIMDITNNFLILKEIQPFQIRFCGLDGTNFISSERCGLQCLIKHSSPYAEYINCCNHRVALCFVHLLKKLPSLISLYTMLLSVWKLFKYSTIKKEVFNDMQRVYESTPLKVIKACTTRWLTHVEACWRIISRFEPLVDQLGCILQRKKMPRCERGQRCSFATTKYLYDLNCCRVIGTNQLLLQVFTNRFDIFFHQEYVRERY